MDRYRVIRKIGTGTYGSAYLVELRSDPAVHLVLKKVKFVESSERERALAEQEVLVLMQLNHPLILR
jgi:serine/threonine protein kinase